MPCKRSPNGITKVVAKLEIASEKTPKTVHECFVESHESTRQRAEIFSDWKSWRQHGKQKDYFDVTSQCGSQVYSDASSDESSGGESSSGQGMEKARNDSSLAILEAQRDKKKVHFATLMDICYLKNAELEPKLQKYKGRVVLRGDIVKDDSGACAVFTAQRLVCVPDEWQVPNWECMFVHRKQELFLSVFVDDIKMAARSRIWLRCGRNWWKKVDVEEAASFLDHENLGCTRT